MNDIVLGGLDLDKGEVRPGHSLFAWDAIQDCAKENCPIYEECNYPKKNKCAVQERYVTVLCKTIVRTYKWLDDVQLTKIGVQILPLYSHLVRLKIIEKGVALEGIVLVNPKGIKYIHPIFKEIRQTLLMINQMWRDLLIRPINLMTPDPSDPSADLNPDNDPRIIDGDPNYYKNLVSKGRDNKTLRRKVMR